MFLGLVWCGVSLLTAEVPLAGQALRMRRVATLKYGLTQGRVVCGDTDHDSLGEIIMVRWPADHWEIWEHRPMNRYEIVYADTVEYPYPQWVTTGSFIPWDIGDVDGDSLTDLLGYLVEGLGGGSWHYVLGTMESPTFHSYPESLTWWYGLVPYPTADYGDCYFAGDMDNDRRQDMRCPGNYEGLLYIFENSGNNQNRLAWVDSAPQGGSAAAFGDFDMDGRREWATAGSSTWNHVYVYENLGDDSYGLSWSDTISIPNGIDAFSGNDLDRDGKPEFFIGFTGVRGTMADFYLFMFEANGNDSYERTLVASVTCYIGLGWVAGSRCGDLNRDSLDELVWSTGSDVFVYEATGNNQFSRVWQWHNPTPDVVRDAVVAIRDLNSNGLNELVLSGNFGGSPGHPKESTFVYELETVELVAPNGGDSLRSGDTCQIRWRVFTPPRCDSVSLYLRRDSLWVLDTIATGFSPGDSTFDWVVPPGPIDSARVVAIAYGPGCWQYDESDSAFKIQGIEEAQPAPVRDWALSVNPNPARGAFAVRYDVPRQCRVSVGVYDAGGRLVRPMSEGDVAPGKYETKLLPGTLPAGIYFCTLAAEGQRFSRKVVLTE